MAARSLRFEHAVFCGLLSRRGRLLRLRFAGAPSYSHDPVVPGGATLFDYLAFVQELHPQLVAVPGGLPCGGGDIVPGTGVGADPDLVISGGAPFHRAARGEVAEVGAERLAGEARHPYGQRFRVFRGGGGGALIGRLSLRALLCLLRGRLALLGAGQSVADHTVAYGQPDQEPQNLAPAYAQPSPPPRRLACNTLIVIQLRFVSCARRWGLAPLLPWQEGYRPARPTGGPGDLERQKDEEGPARGKLVEVGEDFNVAQAPAQTLLVHRYRVVGASDAGSVYTDGLDALVVQVDGARGRRRRPARVLARYQRSAHELLALLALHVVALPAGTEEHDLSGVQLAVLPLPRLDVIRLDKRTHPRLALPGQKAHVHHGRRPYKLPRRHPVAGLVAQRTGDRQVVARGRDEVRWRVEVGAAVLV